MKTRPESASFDGYLEKTRTPTNIYEHPTVKQILTRRVINTHEHRTKAKSIFKYLIHIGPCVDSDILEKHEHPKIKPIPTRTATDIHEHQNNLENIIHWSLQFEMIRIQKSLTCD